MTTRPETDKSMPDAGVHSHRKAGEHSRGPGPVDPLIGKQIAGRFTLRKKLGQGGFGSVYLATQDSIGREVAVKLLHSDRSSNMADESRFFREARSIGGLRSQHTVQLYDFGQSEAGVLFMAMELAGGCTLAELLRQNCKLQAARAVRIAAQVCESLQEAHELGLVHRDLKPANLMVEDRTGCPDFLKVLDFGLAKAMNPEATCITNSGDVFGTPEYLSPEQAAGQGQVTAASDLYSLGVVLFRMLTGALPIKRESRVATAMAHIRERPRDIREYLPSIDERLALLVMSLLHKDPKTRPASAAILRAALLEILGEFEMRAETLLPETTGALRASHQTTEAIRREQGARHLLWGGLVVGCCVVAVSIFFLFVLPNISKENRQTAPAGKAVPPGDDVGPSTTARPAPSTAIAPQPAVRSAIRELRRAPQQATHLSRRALAHLRVRWLDVRTRPNGAVLELDGRIVGSTPSKVAIPDMGAPCSLTVRKPGYKTTGKSIDFDTMDEELFVALKKKRAHSPTKPKGAGAVDDGPAYWGD